MFSLGMIGPWQILLILFLVGVFPTLVALIDILRNEFKGSDKLVWTLVVLFFNLFGAVLYFLIGREQRITS
ncbi:PLDc_N domain-containing protein [Galbibacter sp. BG1]|uniref:PLD nuclease N-terminal domain-containing protein n=1 Tax=Galbibacter sp. BG1 TaxID=1170699 RepID=UPI0015BA9822|nr:PLD nuclease N-terminal domain-containing protein [Galbibacter sp. BG1]QLE00849.1 PLDc_N domain-containing protein [Galbibacter sp. BG1]